MESGKAQPRLNLMSFPFGPWRTVKQVDAQTAGFTIKACT